MFLKRQSNKGILKALFLHKRRSQINWPVCHILRPQGYGLLTTLVAYFLLSSFEFYQKQKLYAPFVNQFMPEPMFFLVVSGRCGAAICRHDLQTLIQSSNWHFIVKPLAVSHFNREIIPRVLTLVVLIVIKIHTDWKTAVTAKNKIDSDWVKILLIMKGTRLKLFW